MSEKRIIPIAPKTKQVRGMFKILRWIEKNKKNPYTQPGHDVNLNPHLGDLLWESKIRMLINQCVFESDLDDLEKQQKC